MSETRTKARARYYKKDKAGEGGTPLKRFERALLTNPKLNPTGRGLLQMAILSNRQEFTMGVAKQAKQLKVSNWVVNKFRRLAVETGLWTEAEDVYKRAGEQWNERFRSCKKISLRVRFVSIVLAMYAGSDDGWVHLSERQLAKQLGAQPDSISKLTGWLESLTDDDGHKLFEVRREAGRRNAYRPMLKEKVSPEEKAPGEKATQRQPKSALYIIETEFGISSSVLKRALMETIRSAHQLGFVDGSEALIRAIGGLYNRIKEERTNGTTPPGMPAPLDLLERYVNWLGDQHWITNKTVALFQFNSQVFGQWRRDQAERDPRLRDPVTGRSR